MWHFIGFFISRIILVIIIFFIITISFGETTISYQNIHFVKHAQTFIPEGWAFFTRNPREIDYVPYVYTKDSLYKTTNYPILSRANNWGVNRNYKAISSEVAYIIERIDPKYWISKSYFNVKEIQDSIKAPIIVKTMIPNPVLIDTICLVAFEPVPWAWYPILSQQNYPCKYIYVKIEK